MEHVHDSWDRFLSYVHFRVTGKHPPEKEAHKAKAKKVDNTTWLKLQDNFGIGKVQNMDSEDDTLAMCEKPHFELFIVIVVMINALLMALELDLSKKNDTLEQRLGWVVVDVSFCVFFFSECVFRIWCLGAYKFFSQPRYLADFFLVLMNVGDTSMQLSGSESEQLEGLSALRILRLVKMTKLFRLVSHVKELNLIATGLVSGLRSLQWVSLLLGVVIFVMAVMFKLLMGRECDDPEIMVAFKYRFPDVDPVVKCEEFWGTVLRAMYTLYQITTLESWSEVLVRPIFDSRPLYVLIVLVFQVVTTFGLLNIVVAAIVDGTMNSTDEAVVENQAQKRIAAHLKVLRDIFLEATPGDSKEVTKDNLLGVLTKAEIRRKLLILDIEFDDPSQIWRIVDADGKGSIGIEDFTTNLMRMRGTAKAKDLLAIRSQIYRVTKNIEVKVDVVSDLCKSMMSSPGTAALTASGEAGPGASTMECFQKEIRGEIWKLSKDFQEQLGSFGDKLASGINQRLDTMNRTSSNPAMPQTPVASRLAAVPFQQPSAIPTEPSIPFFKCGNVAIGSVDRAVGIAPIINSPPLPSTLLPQASRFSNKSQLMVKLEEEHQLLLSRLNLEMPREAQDAVYAEMCKVSEPKALKYSQQPPAASGQAVSTQTDFPAAEQVLVASAPAIQNTSIYNAGNIPGENQDMAGSLVADEQAQETIEKCKKIIPGFEQTLEQKKMEAASKISKAEMFVHGPLFEGFFAFLITANALIMALEVQYTGYDIGFDLKYPGYTRTAKASWPGAHGVFEVLEMIFGVIFVLELLLKIGVLRLKFIKSAWNLLDTVIVGGWLLDSAIGVSSVLNPMMLRLFRLVKLLRVAKLFKSFQAFDSLSILIGSLRASTAVLFWSIVILFTAQLAAALFLSQGLGDFLTEEGLVPGSEAHQSRHKVYEYFGTFSRAFITTTQLTLGNWVPVCRTLFENVNSAWPTFVMVYVILINFAAVKVIAAVFLLETQKVAATDEELLILQKERQITRLIKNFAGVFHAIDSTGDGMVDWDEFQNVIRDHRVLTWLAALDLDIDQCGGMFALLSGSDGKMSFQEFVKGVQRLKGDAKAIDQVLLMKQVEELSQLVVNLQRMMQFQMNSQGLGNPAAQVNSGRVSTPGGIPSPGRSICG